MAVSGSTRAKGTAQEPVWTTTDDPVTLAPTGTIDPLGNTTSTTYVRVDLAGELGRGVEVEQASVLMGQRIGVVAVLHEGRDRARLGGVLRGDRVPCEGRSRPGRRAQRGVAGVGIDRQRHPVGVAPAEAQGPSVEACREP